LGSPVLHRGHKPAAKGERKTQGQEAVSNGVLWDKRGLLQGESKARCWTPECTELYCSLGGEKNIQETPRVTKGGAKKKEKKGPIVVKKEKKAGRDQERGFVRPASEYKRLTRKRAAEKNFWGIRKLRKKP